MGLLGVHVPDSEIAIEESAVSVRTELRTEQPYGEPLKPTQKSQVYLSQSTHKVANQQRRRTDMRGRDPHASEGF